MKMRSEVYFWISQRRQIEHNPARLKILGIKLDFIFRVVLFFCSSNFVIEILLYGGPQKCKLEVEEMRTFFLLT